MDGQSWTNLRPDVGLLAPLGLRVGHGDPDPETDECVCLHTAQELVELLLDVASELSAPNGQRLEHVGDAHGCPDLTRGCFL